jgi:xeroderma pigmentosum group C-complementing protein
MPPKSRGRPGRSYDKAPGTEKASDDVSLMGVSERRTAKGKEKAVNARSETGRARRTKATERAKSASAVPDVFQDMLAETLSSSNVDVVDRPRKRRRVRQPGDDPVNSPTLSYATHDETHVDDDTSLEFEDVITSRQAQTAYNDSEDGSSEDDLAWEEVGITHFPLKSSDAEDDGGDLDLTLTVEKTPQKSSAATRRKALNNVERALRLNVHKMHLLCLLSHVDRRNNWSNDSEVQSALKPLLTKQMMDCLKPKESYTQFGKAESVKKGLSLVTKMWESKYNISAKGMQRPYWAESEQEIRDVGNQALISTVQRAESIIVQAIS